MKSDKFDDMRAEARRITAQLEGDHSVEACLARFKNYTPAQVVELAERGAERTEKRVREGMIEVARRYRASAELHDEFHD
jgi:hypothetical protein